MESKPTTNKMGGENLPKSGICEGGYTSGSKFASGVHKSSGSLVSGKGVMNGTKSSDTSTIRTGGYK